MAGAVFPEVSGASLSRLVSFANSSTTAYSVPYETTMGNPHFYLVKLGGNETAYAKLWEDGNRTYGQFVSDKAEALSLVQKNLGDRDANASVQSLSKSAASRLDGLSSNFTASQKECRRVMGLDTHNCISYDTCLTACSYVPSFCMQIASHEGEKFITALWQYENDTRDFYDLAAKERSAAVVAAAYPSDANLRNYAGALARLDEVGTRLSKTGLLVSEMYCAAPFSPGLIGASRLEVAGAQDLLFEMASENGTASRLAERGAKLNGNSTLPFDLTPNIQKSGGNNTSASSSAGAPPMLPEIDFAFYAPYAALAVIVLITAAFFALKEFRNKKTL